MMRTITSSMFTALAAMLLANSLSGGEPYSAASYSRDGLVAQWDGIENAGLGLPHDESATVWKDLVGDNDLALTTGRGAFDANGLVCAGAVMRR